MKHIILYENWPGIRRKEEKIDLSEIKWAFHWINEGNLFEQMYDVNGIDTTKYILRKQGGKKLEMPSLPPERFVLGEVGHGEVCMTVDPGYYQAGFTGESNVCLVFPLDSLQDLELEDLTDNGEAEIRFKEVPDWNKRVHSIYTTNKVWSRGDGWEGFYYRAISEWFPASLKPLVQTLASPKAISGALSKKN
jgi:hypothetical protein